MNPEDPISGLEQPTSSSRTVLLVTGVLVAMVAVVGLTVGAVLMATRGEQVRTGDVLLLVGVLMAGLAGVGVLAACYALLKGMHTIADQTRALEQRTAALGSAAAPDNPTEIRIAQAAERTQQLLAEVREVLLLPEPLRASRFQALARRELQARLALVDGYIASRDFHRGMAELASLRERFSPSDILNQAEARLGQARREALAKDIEQTTVKVGDLMSTTRWEQAEQYARELTEKYPEAAEAHGLLARVRDERRVFETRHRMRMHEQIQQFVNQRHWREAAGAARDFIETFPAGPDTDILRGQLETLTANAEIEIRQQLERHIKEYVQRGEYWDALSLARRIIAEYPFSPQAGALRAQIGRIEELARQQERGKSR